MKVSFFSHSAERGGAEMVLLETIDLLQENGVGCYVIVPGRGPLLLDLRDIGVDTAIMEFPLWMSPNSTSVTTALKVVLNNSARVFQARRQVCRWMRRREYRCLYGWGVARNQGNKWPYVKWNQNATLSQGIVAIYVKVSSGFLS